MSLRRWRWNMLRLMTWIRDLQRLARGLNAVRARALDRRRQPRGRD